MRLTGLIAIGAIGLVTGCDQLAPFATPPTDAPPPQARPAPVELSAESQKIAAYYKRVEQRQRALDLLRSDGGGPDTPFDNRRLARTFEAVAFSREFSDAGGALVRRRDESILHRWSDPVRIETTFGAAVSDGKRAEDMAAVDRLARRLASATGHPISTVQRGGNFHVLIVTEDQRRGIGPTLKRMLPEIRQREIDVIESLGLSTYCVVVASAPNDDGVLTRAVAVIRAELPPLLRLSCIHEEIAQGLGLSNDSPDARPSIFNDDDEFGRLTTMDEFMLGMLYDPKLTPGMDADAARPIVQDMARALTARAF
ncbi:MAG: DUF2927 domain-containing protein [Boseongicola sp.]|nr:DUF2927 domain-containing protein [Boseongicola sp.]